MRIYERPLMVMEEFVANQAIAACEDNSKDVIFTCLQGPNTDTYGIFNTIEGGNPCSRIPVKIPTANASKVGGNGKTVKNKGYGIYALCVSFSGQVDNQYWNLSTGVHAAGHSGNGGKKPGGSGGGNKPDGGQWHCMAAAISDPHTVSFS